MTIEFDDEFKDRIIELCENELYFHINETDCAEEYEKEILTEIKLLYDLNEKRSAEKYKNQYKKYLKTKCKNDLIQRLNDFWNKLTA